MPPLQTPHGGEYIPGMFLTANDTGVYNLPTTYARDIWGVAALNGWMVAETVEEMIGNLIAYKLKYPIIRNFTEISYARFWATYEYGHRFFQHYGGTEIPCAFDTDEQSFGHLDPFFAEREERLANRLKTLAAYQQWQALMAFGRAGYCLHERNNHANL